MKIVSIMLVVCILLSMCLLTSCDDTPITTQVVDLNKYLAVSFSGYNGSGYVLTQFDTEQFLLDHVNNISWNSKTYQAYVDIYGEPEKSAASEIIKYFNLKVDIDKNLSNGDNIEISWTIKKQVEDYFIIKYKAANKALTVSGLKDKPVNSDNNNEFVDTTCDYSKFIINADKNVTIQNFYEDDEERFYAMQVIGTKLSELTYTDSQNNSYSTKDLGGGKYILEFIEPDCAFCNGMIETVDEYRAKENSINVIGLSIKSGDISAFNKVSETSFMLTNKDNTATKNLVDFVVWVPTFMYIEAGTIRLISYGRMDAEEFEKNIDIAFN